MCANCQDTHVLCLLTCASVRLPWDVLVCKKAPTGAAGTPWKRETILMTTRERGLVKASEAFREYAGRLPWASRPSFYQAVERGEIPCVRFGAAVYIPRWALEALANGDVETLRRHREQSAP